MASPASHCVARFLLCEAGVGRALYDHDQALGLAIVLAITLTIRPGCDPKTACQEGPEDPCTLGGAPGRDQLASSFWGPCVEPLVPEAFSRPA